MNLSILISGKYHSLTSDLCAFKVGKSLTGLTLCCSSVTKVNFFFIKFSVVDPWKNFLIIFVPLQNHVWLKTGREIERHTMRLSMTSLGFCLCLGPYMVIVFLFHIVMTMLLLWTDEKRIRNCYLKVGSCDHVDAENLQQEINIKLTPAVYMCLIDELVFSCWSLAHYPT